MVSKGDGGKCLVINYYALNKITRKFIPLDDTLILKTAFTSPYRKYEYITVPFGLTQAPAYFQELMTDVLKDFPFTIT